jgi:hypothetical protein
MRASWLRSDRQVPVNYGRRERMLHPVEAAWRDGAYKLMHSQSSVWDWALGRVIASTEDASPCA